jgi:hypothetical protein
MFFDQNDDRFVRCADTILLLASHIDQTVNSSYQGSQGSNFCFAISIPRTVTDIINPPPIFISTYPGKKLRSNQPCKCKLILI